jgi:DNA-binding transcriptional LysR family regulator
LVGVKNLQLSDLANEDFLMRETGSGIRSHIEKVFEQYQFMPNIKMELGGNEAIRLGLLENLGITVTSIPTLMEEINAGKLAVLDVQGFPIKRYWYLVYPKGKTLSLAAETLISLLKAEAALLTSGISK